MITWHGKPLVSELCSPFVESNSTDAWFLANDANGSGIGRHHLFDNRLFKFNRISRHDSISLCALLVFLGNQKEATDSLTHWAGGKIDFCWSVSKKQLSAQWFDRVWQESTTTKNHIRADPHPSSSSKRSLYSTGGLR